MLDVWRSGFVFRVWHWQFDQGRGYRAVAITDYGPAGRAYVWFFTSWGGLWAVPQSRCLLVNVDPASPPCRLLEGTERDVEMPRPRPRSDWP